MGLASGLLEPLAAIRGGLVLNALLTPRLVGAMLAFVAWVMPHVGHCAQ